MPRKPRIEYAGAVYHVMSRGDHGEPTFQDDADRELFIKTLSAVCGRTGWIIHAYVLMVNHYHLLLETPEANLVTGMHWLQGTYTMRYNTRHNLRGHLFQGRYKALIMNPLEDGWMRRVSTYIHMNPVRGSMACALPGKLWQYRWSSYPFYVGRTDHCPVWLATARVMASVGIASESIGARHRYAKYLEGITSQLTSGSEQRKLLLEWKSIRHGWCLGNNAFRSEMLGRIERVISGHKKSSYSGMAIQAHDVMMAERKLKKVLAFYKLSPTLLVGMKKSDAIKQVIAWALRRQTVVSNLWLSEKLALGHPANVPGYVRNVEQAKTGKIVFLRQQVVKTLKSEV